jgi:hypothetical protein
MFGKDKRHWVNWKSIVTFFALASSNLPSDAELAGYRVALTDAGKDQRISLAEFLQVSTWFDKSEGKPDRKLLATWQEERQRKALSSDYDSDEDEEDLEDRLDSGRLQGVKTILFNTHRVNTGEDYLEIPQFIDALIQMVSSVGGEEATFGDRLLRC